MLTFVYSYYCDYVCYELCAVSVFVIMRKMHYPICRYVCILFGIFYIIIMYIITEKSLGNGSLITLCSDNIFPSQIIILCIFVYVAYKIIVLY